jgi:hypothetical protein
MPLTFPTRATTSANHLPPKMGEPTRAVACWCPNAWLDEPGSCCRCGHWTHDAIVETWRAQAKRTAAYSAPTPELAGVAS